jgi:NAD(P)-dependent dehydrogenase (short-subunit alcohol dehydrogenase family)
MSLSVIAATESEPTTWRLVLGAAMREWGPGAEHWLSRRISPIPRSSELSLPLRWIGLEAAKSWAGVERRANFREVSRQDYALVLYANLNGVFFITQAVGTAWYGR